MTVNREEYVKLIQANAKEMKLVAEALSLLEKHETRWNATNEVVRISADWAAEAKVAEVKQVLDTCLEESVVKSLCHGLRQSGKCFEGARGFLQYTTEVVQEMRSSIHELKRRQSEAMATEAKLHRDILEALGLKRADKTFDQFVDSYLQGLVVKQWLKGTQDKIAIYLDVDGSQLNKTQLQVLKTVMDKSQLSKTAWALGDPTGFFLRRDPLLTVYCHVDLAELKTIAQLECVLSISYHHIPA